MGYSHYYTQKRDFTYDEWDRICFYAKRLLRNKEAYKIIDNTDKWDQKLFINKNAIRFNGIGDDGHETFYLKKKLKPTEWESAGGCFEKGEEFQFTKTARKDYDKYVVALLCIINFFAGDAVRIESDGDKEEWKDGHSLAIQQAPGLVRPGNLEEKYAPVVHCFQIPEGVRL